MLTERAYKDPNFYFLRYAISACMQDTEVRALRNGGKSSNWKKAVPTKICLQETNWKNLDIKDSIQTTKVGITDVEISTADDKKTQFVTITFSDQDTFVFTANKEVLDMFFTGISLTLNRTHENDWTAAKINEFRKMIIERTKFQQRIEKELSIPILPPEPTCFPEIDPKELN